MDQNSIDKIKGAAMHWLAPIGQSHGGRFSPNELNSIANAIIGALMEYEDLHLQK